MIRPSNTLKMKGLIIGVFMLAGCAAGWAQNKDAWMAENKAYRVEQNENFKNPEKSPLTKKDLKKFEALDFYPIDLDFRVVAAFVRSPNEEPFRMPTSTARMAEYVKYGELHFELKGRYFVLSLYQNTNHENQEGYEDYLFLPFTDLTNGDSTYGGGRYLEMWIPKGETVVIDFNQAYNPYCAYSPNYSCPIPPEENDLSIRIEAGVKDYKNH